MGLQLSSLCLCPLSGSSGDQPGLNKTEIMGSLNFPMQLCIFFKCLKLENCTDQIVIHCWACPVEWVYEAIKCPILWF